MSVDDSPSTTASPVNSPRPPASASYLPCRRCGEGSLVYDADRGTSICRCCGAADD